MYRIGRHRFVEMARVAGAVYKMNAKYSWGNKTEVDIGEQMMEEETDNNV